MSLPDEATRAARYGLLCRALQALPEADDPQTALEGVTRLEELVRRDLLELSRRGSPDDFAQIYVGFERELERFREFCAYPPLAQKRVVAFGGPFSAGKSSLINALIGEKLLVVQVDPTTALPAYLLQGEEDALYALNLHRVRVPLTVEELASLTHDELRDYGSQVSRALRAAFVARRHFPWAHLALLDTPGYSGQALAGDRTDADIARAQLNSAHAIVWVTSVKQGDISQEDLDFLATLDRHLPVLVAVTRADQLDEMSRAAVIARMRATLAARNLPVLDVLPVSSRPRHAELLEPLKARLDAWNSPLPQRFTHRFKTLFVRYHRGLEREQDETRWLLARARQLVLTAEGEAAKQATEMQTVLEQRLEDLDAVAEGVEALQRRFFAELKAIGAAVGMALPEPHELELIELAPSPLLELLIAAREQAGAQAPDTRLWLPGLRQPGVARRRGHLLRRQARNAADALVPLTEPAPARHLPQLLRRMPRAGRAVFSPLC